MRRSDLVRLYPARWRRRYEPEFRDLLDRERLSAGLVIDVLGGALRARRDPYPAAATHRESTMTTRRIETTAAWAAAILVLPSLVLLAAAIVRAHPTDIVAGNPGDQFRAWFASLRPATVALVAGPIVALPLALVALARRVGTDTDVQTDVVLLVQVSVRLLRRPVLWLGALAIVGSMAGLVFAALAH
jgi:hypothetical protein